MARAPSPPSDAPNPTRTFIGEGTRTTGREARNISRGEPGDLAYESMPAEVDLHDLIGPYRGNRVGRPPPEPVGGYGTDEYAPGYIGGVKFPTHNITPGNKVFDLGNRIPSDWIPYRGGAPDSVRNEGSPDQMFSTNFDPRAAGMLTPSDLQMIGQQTLSNNDQFNNPRNGFFGPLRNRFIPMQDGGEIYPEEESTEQLVGASGDDLLRRQMLEAGPGGGSGGGGGRPTYASIPRYLEDALSQHAQGQMSSRDVQEVFRRMGWGVNLRKGRVGPQAVDPNGQVHFLHGGDFRRGGAMRRGGATPQNLARLRTLMRMFGGRI